MSDPQRHTELIYLPRPSGFPVVVAAGIALIVLGLFAWWPYTVVGVIVAVWGFIGWMRDNRREIARMPREQEETPARIPLK